MAVARSRRFGVVAILAIFLPLYFPTGRLLSPRWRPVLWLGIAYLSAAIISNALQPGPEEWLVGYPLQRNPVAYLPAAKPLLDVIGLAELCLLPGIAGAIASLVVRVRRSRGIVRQQLKWFTYAAALAPLPFLVCGRIASVRAGGWRLDLETLSIELLAVVDQTMEPTRVSLWLRPSPPGPSGTDRSEPRPTSWAY